MLCTSWWFYSIQQGILLELNSKKPYDKVNWDFVPSVGKKRLGCEMERMDYVSRAMWKTGCLYLNGERERERGSFWVSSFKGLRHGGPYLHFSFKLMVEVLHALIYVKLIERGFLQD